jgi:hypothetical protein
MSVIYNITVTITTKNININITINITITRLLDYLQKQRLIWNRDQTRQVAPDSCPIQRR